MSIETLKASTTKVFIDTLNENFNAIHPIGSLWIGGKDSKNQKINPVTMFGRDGEEWELVDKEFENQLITYSSKEDINNYIIPNNDVLKDGFRNLIIRRQGHSIVFTGEADIKDNYTNTAESGVELFSLRYNSTNSWGINFKTSDNIIQKQYTLILDDTGNKIFMLAIDNEKVDEDYKKITIKAMDTVPSKEPLAGGVIGFTIRLDFSPEHMVDDYCDKFYWKRIS